MARKIWDLEPGAEFGVPSDAVDWSEQSVRGDAIANSGRNGFKIIEPQKTAELLSSANQEKPTKRFGRNDEFRIIPPTENQTQVDMLLSRYKLALNEAIVERMLAGWKVVDSRVVNINDGYVFSGA